MGRLRLEDLKDDPRNPPEIPDHKRKALRFSLETFGDISGFVWNKTTGYWVCGHQRYAGLKEKYGDALVLKGNAIKLPNGETFQIRIVEWTEAKALAAMTAANSLELQGRFTDDLGEVLDTIGHDLPDLVEPLRFDQLGGPVDPAPTDQNEDGDPADDLPPWCIDPVVKDGDLWTVGPHRVLIGDSHMNENIDRLLDGATPNLYLSDPPYAIYGSATGIGSDIADTKMVQPFFTALFKGAVRVLPDFAHLYVHCDWRSYPVIIQMAERVGLAVKNCLIWDKGGGGLGSAYMNSHEFVAFWAKLPPPKAMVSSAKTGQRVVRKSNVFRINRPTGEDRLHNAAKPVELVGSLIENSSDEGQIVLDPFLGSGTTIVAAHLKARIGYGCDMDPKFGQVALQRLQTITQQPATREDGETLDHLVELQDRDRRPDPIPEPAAATGSS